MSIGCMYVCGVYVCRLLAVVSGVLGARDDNPMD